MFTNVIYIAVIAIFLIAGVIAGPSGNRLDRQVVVASSTPPTPSPTVSPTPCPSPEDPEKPCPTPSPMPSPSPTIKP